MSKREESFLANLRTAEQAQGPSLGACNLLRICSCLSLTSSSLERIVLGKGRLA